MARLLGSAQLELKLDLNNACFSPTSKLQLPRLDTFVDGHLAYRQPNGLCEPIVHRGGFPLKRKKE
jgi:hypothetical protein